MARGDKQATRPDPASDDPTAVEADDTALGAAPSALPAAIRLASPYGYYTDDGALRMWAQRAVVTDPDEIADLINRGAPIEEVFS